METRNFDVRNLNEEEKQIFYYAYCAVGKNGLLLTNDEICKRMNCSESYLIRILDKVQKKINQSKKYID